MVKENNGKLTLTTINKRKLKPAFTIALRARVAATMTVNRDTGNEVIGSYQPALPIGDELKSYMEEGAVQDKCKNPYTNCQRFFLHPSYDTVLYCYAMRRDRYQVYQ